MNDPMDSFDNLIKDLAAGSEAAAIRLVEQFEPEIRRFIRFRLTRPEIRRFIDSVDISQSVLAKFFVEIGQGNFDLTNSKQLKNLLLTMASNKLKDHVRRSMAAKRAGGKLADQVEMNSIADSENSPSTYVMHSEILNAFRDQLTDEERHIVDERMNGRSWVEIGDELNMTTDAVRKRLTRAVDRAAVVLGVIKQ